MFWKNLPDFISMIIIFKHYLVWLLGLNYRRYLQRILTEDTYRRYLQRIPTKDTYNKIQLYCTSLFNFIKFSTFILNQKIDHTFFNNVLKSTKFKCRFICMFVRCICIYTVYVIEIPICVSDTLCLYVYLQIKIHVYKEIHNSFQ